MQANVNSGLCGFLTGDLEVKVIPDVMDDLIIPQGKDPENFELISLLKVCQEWIVKKDGT